MVVCVLKKKVDLCVNDRKSLITYHLKNIIKSCEINFFKKNYKIIYYPKITQFIITSFFNYI